MRYYFDVIGDVADEEGTEFPDTARMENAALRFLLELASERLGEPRQNLGLTVRDSEGSCIYQAQLRICGVKRDKTLPIDAIDLSNI